MFDDVVDGTAFLWGRRDVDFEQEQDAQNWLIDSHNGISVSINVAVVKSATYESGS